MLEVKSGDDDPLLDFIILAGFKVIFNHFRGFYFSEIATEGVL